MKIRGVFLVLAVLLAFYSFACAQEKLVLTTYYPSPNGSYDQLGANKLAVDISNVAVTTEYVAMQNGDVHIGRSLIVGAGGGSGFAYDERIGPPDTRPADGDVLIKGNVGIGTSTPRTRLELANDGAILASGVYNQGWIEPKFGRGTRLLWYPRKAAFRAGYVTADQWDNVNIGRYSTAMGYSTTASGSYSTAMGVNTTASGFSSTAMGYRANANANGSFVWADSQESDFDAPSIDTFNIRAKNGVYVSNNIKVSGKVLMGVEMVSHNFKGKGGSNPNGAFAGEVLCTQVGIAKRKKVLGGGCNANPGDVVNSRPIWDPGFDNYGWHCLRSDIIYGNQEGSVFAICADIES